MHQTPKSDRTLTHYILVKPYNREWTEHGRGERDKEGETLRASQRLTQRGAQRSREGEEEKKRCPCSKGADSPLFFQLRTGAANSAYSKLAYGNKAVWEITVETRGISNPLLFHLSFLCSSSHHNPFSTITSPSPKALLGALALPLTAPVLSSDKMITLYSLISIYCTGCEDQTQIPSLYLSLIAGLSLAEQHYMYPLHFMWCRVQPDLPLFGCYYGDASRPKTKAEQKLSSLRQEPLAAL